MIDRRHMSPTSRGLILHLATCPWILVFPAGLLFISSQEAHLSALIWGTAEKVVGFNAPLLFVPKDGTEYGPAARSASFALCQKPVN